jgi:putative transposase
MKPYSQDLRERILRALQAREGAQGAIAQRFAVSRSFVERLWPRWRQTGSCAALPHAGGRQRSLCAADPLIRQSVERDPDITLAHLCEHIARRKGIRVSTKTMCVELQRLRLPRKKRRSTPRNATPRA